MFERSKPQQVFGSYIEQESLPLPEGQSLSQGLLDNISELPEELRLQLVGLVTPWAKQKDDSEWEEVVAPKWNIEISNIQESQVRQAFHKLHGQPLPYLGILSKHLPTRTEIEDALAGTDYEFYETIAVYSQKDSQHVPDIRFFHWISSKALGERKFHSLSVAVRALQGALVFAERVPYLTTSTRGHPAINFNSAIHTRAQQAVSGEVVQIPEITIVGSTKPQVSPWLVTAGITVLAAVGVGILSRRRSR